MQQRHGTLIGCTDNIVEVELSADAMLAQGEIGYIELPDKDVTVQVMAEVLEVRENSCVMQVFEPTEGLCNGLKVTFSGDPLSIQVGPGMLGTVYDGLQNPLKELAHRDGFFLKRGSRVDPLDSTKMWDFVPTAKIGDTVAAGQVLGCVKEFHFEHKIMVPFDLSGDWEVISIESQGECCVSDTIAVIKNEDGKEVPVTMVQRMVVKKGNTTYRRRLPISDYLPTGMRIIDALIPVPIGGSASIPGAFGTGKTVLQHAIAKHASIDVVIVCACGERAGEVVETIKEFPHLADPQTGSKLSDRTVIICNTSSMPTAAREASVFVASSLAEYYRNMGLNVLILADSTSRWAQGMREAVSARGQIPGARGFPADLEMLVASFYARSGKVETANGDTGSITIIGTVSPAGGDFSDPVVQATLPQNQAFWGLDQPRADSKKYPAIDVLQSWSKIDGSIPQEKVVRVLELLRKSTETQELMVITGEDGIGMDAFLNLLLAELFDGVFLQQNSFHPVDASSPAERQEKLFDWLYTLCFDTELDFDPVVEKDENDQPRVVQSEKEVARKWANLLAQTLRSWNLAEQETEEEGGLWAEAISMVESAVSLEKEGIAV